MSGKTPVREDKIREVVSKTPPTASSKGYPSGYRSVRPCGVVSPGLVQGDLEGTGRAARVVP